MADNLLDALYTADPDFAAEISRTLTPEDVSILLPHLQDFVDDTVWALSMEFSMARKVAAGYLALVRADAGHQLAPYHHYLRRFGEDGPAKGKIMAETLAAVLKIDHGEILDRFLAAVDVMLEKGTYTLYGPLNALVSLCEEKDFPNIRAYLSLLSDTFSLAMTYRQCRPFTYTLPKAALSFSAPKRAFQMKQLGRVIRADFTLTDFFLEGISKGLRLLTREALEYFVSRALDGLAKNKRRCARFLSLDSSLGRNTFEDLQVAVPLSQVRFAVGRYINARTGKPIPIHQIPQEPKVQDEGRPFSYSDGAAIWLPGEINRFDDRHGNALLYKYLAKLEAGFFEFNTFDFDLERLIHRLGEKFKKNLDTDSSLPDLAIFLNSFSDPDLAANLFTVFEHGRIKDLTAAGYPGLVRRVLPEFQDEACRMGNAGLMQRLYHVIALGMPANRMENITGIRKDAVHNAERLYRDKMPENPVVETSAELVFLCYPEIAHAASLLPSENDGELTPPYHRKIDPVRFFAALSAMDQRAARIKIRLAHKDVRVYRSDVRKKLSENSGDITPAELREVILQHPDAGEDPNRDAAVQVSLSNEDLADILAESGVKAAPGGNADSSGFFYPEWDRGLGDYLHRHTRVADRRIPGAAGGFYTETLERRRGLVKRIRYAFELLRPEGITILRQWVEGDAFDYRALLDFAMDKKAGIMPSDRLYIKRIKQQRDVAVMLLVDMSRSTANTVVESEDSVLDVAKEAIVLFCEALTVLGDRYAIAGFSGTGRLGVDFFRIKDFDETLDIHTKQRINAMAPQRSTRMGAAVRHAAFRLAGVSAAVKLLIIIGDGFPNDVDYKQDYALEDTRKAISEARSKNIHTHGLTVNIAGDPKLDDLYGNVHHNVISDVRELPVKLPRIYSTLTRH